MKKKIHEFWSMQSEGDSDMQRRGEIEIQDITDGYHTFRELYDHRMKLFAVICQQNWVHAWKSKKHSDGTMYPDYFIVGVNTPTGQFSYHYHIKHWELFEVITREYAPEWDGHTADDITRLLSL